MAYCNICPTVRESASWQITYFTGRIRTGGGNDRCDQIVYGVEREVHGNIDVKLCEKHKNFTDEEIQNYLERYIRGSFRSVRKNKGWSDREQIFFEAPVIGQKFNNVRDFDWAVLTKDHWNEVYGPTGLTRIPIS